MDKKDSLATDNVSLDENGAGQEELKEGDLEQVAGGADVCPPIFVTKAPPDSFVVIKGATDGTDKDISYIADESGTTKGIISNSTLEK